MMTLDRWKGIIDQMHYDSLGNDQNCKIRNMTAWYTWIQNGEGDKFLEFFLIGFFLFAWVWFGNFVFKNLFTGVVVNNFLAHNNELRSAENEANVEKELQTIAEEIEEEVKRVEIVPKFNAAEKTSEESMTSSSNSNYDDENLIEKYEKQAEFWRENYYKPWRYPCMVRLFPSMSSKIESMVHKFNAPREAKFDDAKDPSESSTVDTLDILNQINKNQSIRYLNLKL